MTDHEARIIALEASIAELRALLTGPAKASKGYTAKFEAIWGEYRRSPNMSKPEAFKAYNRALQFAGHEAILLGIKGYNTWLDKQKDHPVAHLATFLNQRRFEGFLNEAQTESIEIFTVEKGTPDWDAWVDYRLSRGIKYNPDRLTVPSLSPPQINGHAE